MRNYIFTQKELNIIQEFLKTEKRMVAFNKLLHFIRHNSRILEDVQIYLILLGLAQKRRVEPLKLPPRRPSKLGTALKGDL
jgi:hypothetical protein